MGNFKGGQGIATDIVRYTAGIAEVAQNHLPRGGKVFGEVLSRRSSGSTWYLVLRDKTETNTVEVRYRGKGDPPAIGYMASFFGNFRFCADDKRQTFKLVYEAHAKDPTPKQSRRMRLRQENLEKLRGRYTVPAAAESIRRIAILTSNSSVAFRDVTRELDRYGRNVQLDVFRVLVSLGDPRDFGRALAAQMTASPRPDVIVMTRGAEAPPRFFNDCDLVGTVARVAREIPTKSQTKG